MMPILDFWAVPIRSTWFVDEKTYTYASGVRIADVEPPVDDIVPTVSNV
jgi:hypothetical protein